LDSDLSPNDFFPLLHELIVLAGIRFKNFSKMHAKRRWLKNMLAALCRGAARFPGSVLRAEVARRTRLDAS
jgi:hypothetical protein